MAPVSDIMSSSPPPEGNYKFACIALDLTGRKLIDEICQVGAYAYPDKSFSQYVMPHRDISRGASRTFGIKIFTNFGRYRVLKDMKTMKTLKTKSEYSTLTEFMEWLKEVKGSSDGVLLGFHDNKNQAVTPFLMEALERYKMTDDFFDIVKGFVCAQVIAEDHLDENENATPVSLKGLAKRFLELEDSKSGGVFHSAKDRAEIIYKLAQKMMEQEGEVNSDDLMKYVSGRKQEMENLEKQRGLAQKVRSLRPVFASKIKAGIKDRNRAISLRRYLIDAQLAFEDLSKAYEDGQKDAVTEMISKTPAQKKEKDMEDLIEMIVTFFKDGGENASVKKAERDVNGNMVKKMGQGDGQPTGASTSSTDTSEEEFEEAKERMESAEISPTK